MDNTPTSRAGVTRRLSFDDEQPLEMAKRLTCEARRAVAEAYTDHSDARKVTRRLAHGERLPGREDDDEDDEDDDVNVFCESLPVDAYKLAVEAICTEYRTTMTVKRAFTKAKPGAPGSVLEKFEERAFDAKRHYDNELARWQGVHLDPLAANGNHTQRQQASASSDDDDSDTSNTRARVQHVVPAPAGTPVFRGDGARGIADANTFVEAYANHLTGGMVPTHQWATMLLMHVADECKTWVRTHIVDRNLAWAAARDEFLAHYSTISDYYTQLTKWTNIRQHKDETIQAFNDRVASFATTLELDDGDKAASVTYLNALAGELGDRIRLDWNLRAHQQPSPPSLAALQAFAAIYETASNNSRAAQHDRRDKYENSSYSNKKSNSSYSNSDSSITSIASSSSGGRLYNVSHAPPTPGSAAARGRCSVHPYARNHDNATCLAQALQSPLTPQQQATKTPSSNKQQTTSNKQSNASNCYNCNEPGHYASSCTKPRATAPTYLCSTPTNKATTHRTTRTATSSSTLTETAAAHKNDGGQVIVTDFSTREMVRMPCLVDGAKAMGVVDTGAARSIVSIELADKLSIPRRRSKTSVVGVFGDEGDTWLCDPVWVQAGDCRTKYRFLAVPMSPEVHVLLGRDLLGKFGIRVTGVHTTYPTLLVECATRPPPASTTTTTSSTSSSASSLLYTTPSSASTSFPQPVSVPTTIAASTSLMSPCSKRETAVSTKATAAAAALAAARDDSESDDEEGGIVYVPFLRVEHAAQQHECGEGSSRNTTTMLSRLGAKRVGGEELPATEPRGSSMTTTTTRPALGDYDTRPLVLLTSLSFAPSLSQASPRSPSSPSLPPTSSISSGDSGDGDNGSDGQSNNYNIGRGASMEPHPRAHATDVSARTCVIAQNNSRVHTHARGNTRLHASTHAHTAPIDNSSDSSSHGHPRTHAFARGDRSSGTPHAHHSRRNPHDRHPPHTRTAPGAADTKAAPCTHTQTTRTHRHDSSRESCPRMRALAHSDNGGGILAHSTHSQHHAQNSRRMRVSAITAPALAALPPAHHDKPSGVGSSSPSVWGGYVAVTPSQSAPAKP